MSRSRKRELPPRERRRKALHKFYTGSGVVKRFNKIEAISRMRRVRAAILSELEPLVAKATRESLNFYLACQNKTFTPKELVEELGRGRYVWGVKWWDLRPALEAV